MTVYVAHYDFYALIEGIFLTKEEAIAAARKYYDGWVEEWQTGTTQLTGETVWRAKDDEYTEDDDD